MARRKLIIKLDPRFDATEKPLDRGFIGVKKQTKPSQPPRWARKVGVTGR